MDVQQATQHVDALVEVYGTLPHGRESTSAVGESVAAIVRRIIEPVVVREARRLLPILDASAGTDAERNETATRWGYELAMHLFPVPSTKADAFREFAASPESLAAANASISYALLELWHIFRFGGGFDASASLVIQSDLESYLELVGNTLVIPETRRVFGEMLYLNNLIVESVTGSAALRRNRFDDSILSVPAAYVEAEQAFQAAREADRNLREAAEAAVQAQAHEEAAAQAAAHRAAVWNQQEAERRSELAKQRLKTGFGIAGVVLKTAWDIGASERDYKKERGRQREEEAHRRTVQENSRIINERLHKQERGW
ncbi:hypothetical protein [Clavibacter michiganensis]|uniref:hypothetical protein n=1 Tax=Clavibacter michiganensis TaxID=28447 RepID=UPI0005BDE809|nr:hypothetical protein [Clavibacter michiganensis]